jgi:hypothetical protein
VKLGTAALAAFVCVACHPSHGARVSGSSASASFKIESCDYELGLSPSGVVSVAVTCKANAPVTFRLTSPSIVRSVSGAKFDEAGVFSGKNSKLSYAVDLADRARDTRNFDSAAHVGESFMAPMSAVLVVPEPLTTEIPVKVRVSAPPGLPFAVGLARAGELNTYQLMAHEIPVATYFAFGKLEQRELSLGDATLEISKLDGALSQSFAELSAWVATSAGAVRDFYGTFPVPRASVTVLPVPERDGVVFGKVLPESAPGIALLVGQRASRKSLYSDWILVHELFHLGFPSFFGEGKWLDEGLATYYEPIIRVRAGLYTEEQLWQELAEAMPQGLPAFTERGLETADDFRGIYWGGAMACLVADVEARKRDTGRGLEVGLRALRDAGGNACEVWSLSDAIATIDRALGAPTLAPIAAQHGAQGQPFDFERLLRDLGVLRSAGGNIRLSDEAPLAAIRRAITARP